MYFTVALASSHSSTTHKCWEKGQPIRGPRQPTLWPIQRRFGPSWVSRVYFLHKSTYFHDMRAECQIIKTSHSFLTVIMIWHKYPVIYWLLATWSFPNHYPIAPQSDEAVLSNFFLVSEAENLNPTSKIAFPDPILSLVNETDHWR